MRRGTLILLMIGAVGLAFLLWSIPQHAFDVCTPSGHAPAPIGIPPPLCNENYLPALAALAGAALMVGSLVLLALRWRIPLGSTNWAAVLILIPSVVVWVSLAFALRAGRTDTIGAPISSMTYGPPELAVALPPAIALAAVIAVALFGTSLIRRLLQRRRH
jgi:hypothetical protein